jgi:hypothetical protein
LSHSNEEEVSSVYANRASNTNPTKARAQWFHNLVPQNAEKYEGHDKIIEVEKCNFSFKDNIFSSVQQVPIVVW